MTTGNRAKAAQSRELLFLKPAGYCTTSEVCHFQLIASALNPMLRVLFSLSKAEAMASITPRSDRGSICLAFVSKPSTISKCVQKITIFWLYGVSQPSGDCIVGISHASSHAPCSEHAPALHDQCYRCTFQRSHKALSLMPPLPVKQTPCSALGKTHVALPPVWTSFKGASG